MNDVESFRGKIVLEVNTPGQSGTILTNLEIGRDGRTRAAVLIDTPRGGQNFETITAPPEIYLWIRGLGWFCGLGEDAGEAADPLQGLGTGLLSDLLPSGETPWELYTVESLGREEVDGVQAEHISITVNIQDLVGLLDEQKRQQFLESQFPGGGPADELLQRIGLRNVEEWIDDEGYTRRRKMELVVDEETTTKLDMRMFDFNEDVVIELPKDYRVGIPGQSESSEPCASPGTTPSISLPQP